MFEPRYSDQTKNTTYIVGIAIYEKVDRGMAYNSWTGFGDALNPENQTYTSWFVTKHQLDFKAPAGFVISPGVRATFMPDWGSFTEEKIVSEGFVKFSYDLW
jgi:hypothetical protein